MIPLELYLVYITILSLLALIGYIFLIIKFFAWLESKERPVNQEPEVKVTPDTLGTHLQAVEQAIQRNKAKTE